VDLLYRYFEESAANAGSHSTALRGVVGWDLGPAGVFAAAGGEHRVTVQNDNQGKLYGAVGVQLF
jgi:hypothetical protein